MATNISIQNLTSGDNEMMKIEIYLDANLGSGTPASKTMLEQLIELKRMLTDEVVHFVFEKTDGTRRDAYGTRAVDVIRKYESVAAAQRPQRAFNGTFPYFDIEKGEWRCFRVDRFVMIDRDYTI